MSFFHFSLSDITKNDPKTTTCPQDIHMFLAIYPLFYENYPQFGADLSTHPFAIDTNKAHETSIF